MTRPCWLIKSGRRPPDRYGLGPVAYAGKIGAGEGVGAYNDGLKMLLSGSLAPEELPMLTTDVRRKVPVEDVSVGEGFTAPAVEGAGAGMLMLVAAVVVAVRAGVTWYGKPVAGLVKSLGTGR